MSESLHFHSAKTLRENTCPIASGDYSTPVSQRTRLALRFGSPIIHRIPLNGTLLNIAFFRILPVTLQGAILTSLQLTKELIGNASTTAGLKVVACILDKVYATGRKVAAGFKESMRIVFDKHLRQWNYTAVPEKTALAID